MVMIETHHERYMLNTEIPMQVADDLFGLCELSGADLDAFVTEAITAKLKGGRQ